MKSVTAYAPDGEHVTIICPECGTMRHGSLRKIKILKHAFCVRCSCGVSFKLVLELRKSYRKTTYLLGTCIRAGHPRDPISIVVENLSLTGAGVSYDTSLTLRVGENLKIEFTLDDHKKTSISKRATVRHVHEGYAGCEFDSAATCDKDLGFYLMP